MSFNMINKPSTDNLIDIHKEARTNKLLKNLRPYKLLKNLRPICQKFEKS